jgi:hypothetical protein
LAVVWVASRKKPISLSCCKPQLQPIDTAEEYDRRFNEAVTDYLESALLGYVVILPILSYPLK